MAKRNNEPTSGRTRPRCVSSSLRSKVTTKACKKHWGPWFRRWAALCVWSQNKVLMGKLRCSC